MGRRAITALLLVPLLLGMTSCRPKPVVELPVEGNITDLAVDYIARLAKGDFSAASVLHDAGMRTALPGNKLAEVWQGIIAQFGSYQNQLGTEIGRIHEFDLIFVTVHFERAFVRFRVVFNSNKQVAGFFIDSVEDSLTHLYQAPSYALHDSYTESEVIIGSGQWALPATLTLPAAPSPHPAVILVHGSGPHDRNETIGPNQPFKDLAWGLASQGIAVLRYDKRTKVHGARMDVNSITVWEEVVEDAVEAVRFLQADPRIDSSGIFVLGHSLGATVAPRIAAATEGIAGLILLAGASRPLEDVILDQVTYLGSTGHLPEGEAAVAEVRAQVTRVKSPNLSVNTPREQLPLGIAAPYWLDLRDFSPVQAARDLGIPLLVLQGERDYQVTMADFALWQQALHAQPGVHFKSYPALNHLFIAGEGQITPQEYYRPGNVAREVIDDITRWLRERMAK
ncbi:MAG: alpha/beta fold hydrolase [Bacillota bacterium]